MTHMNGGALKTATAPTMPDLPASGETEKQLAEFEAVTKSLRKAIRPLQVLGIITLLLGATFAAVSLIWLLPGAASHAINQINAAGSNATLILIYEIFRGTAYASVVFAVVFGTLTLGRAFLDQATRYQKREIASYFLHYVLDVYEREIKEGKIKLPDVVSFLYAWSQNVESAFTNVKFGSRKQPPVEMSTGFGGPRISEGQRS